MTFPFGAVVGMDDMRLALVLNAVSPAVGGVLENDGFRRAFLAEVAGIAGRRFVAAPDTDFAAVREARLDRLGDLVAQHADTDALWRLIDAGPPAGLPLLPPGSTAR